MITSLTRASLETNHPELFAELAAEFMVEGAQAERDRVAGVLAQATPGYESLIEKMSMDGKTTPGEAAMAVTAGLRKELIGARQAAECRAVADRAVAHLRRQ